MNFVKLMRAGNGAERGEFFRRAELFVQRARIDHFVSGIDRRLYFIRHSKIWNWTKACREFRGKRYSVRPNLQMGKPLSVGGLIPCDRWKRKGVEFQHGLCSELLAGCIA